MNRYRRSWKVPSPEISKSRKISWGESIIGSSGSCTTSGLEMPRGIYGGKICQVQAIPLAAVRNYCWWITFIPCSLSPPRCHLFQLSGVSRQCPSTNSHKTLGYSLERSCFPKTWNLSLNMELKKSSPFPYGFFQVNQVPFKTSEPGLDRLAAPRDVTVAVTLADEKRTWIDDGRFGIQKRRFQKRRETKRLQEECEECRSHHASQDIFSLMFFSHGKSHLLAIIFFGLMFPKMYFLHFMIYIYIYICL